MYRLEQEFNRQGLKLSRQTMANWLQPVYDVLHKQLCKEPALHADGYQGYHRLPGNIRVVGCWAHARRKFDEALQTLPKEMQKDSPAAIGECDCSRLFKLEQALAELTPEERYEKWLTDITEFAIPAGKVYLSPIIDCFDGMPVCWSIGTSPNAELTNGMLDKAISLLKVGEHPVVHTDRGCHYRWPGWISRMEAAHLHRSMSKKGCSPDNSACEGFFGRMKTEMFYGVSWLNVSIEEFIHTVEDYMVWYREK